MKQILSLIMSLSLLVFPVSDRSKGRIALTFDDGPSGAVTDRLLEGLAQRQVRATFFVCCYRMEQYPDTLTRIVEGGHEVGLHSCCHQFMHRMTREEIQADLETCTELLGEYAGIGASLFRPPGGLYNDALLEICKEMDLSVVLWSVDPEDWKPGSGSRVLPYLLRHTSDGDIVLLHDLYDSSVDAALGLIDRLQAQGYEIGTVSQLAADRNVSLRPGQIYQKFPLSRPASCASKKFRCAVFYCLLTSGTFCRTVTVLHRLIHARRDLLDHNQYPRPETDLCTDQRSPLPFDSDRRTANQRASAQCPGNGRPAGHQSQYHPKGLPGVGA